MLERPISGVSCKQGDDRPWLLFPLSGFKINQVNPQVKNQETWQNSPTFTVHTHAHFLTALRPSHSMTCLVQQNSEEVSDRKALISSQTET